MISAEASAYTLKIDSSNTGLGIEIFLMLAEYDLSALRSNRNLTFATTADFTLMGKA